MSRVSVDYSRLWLTLVHRLQPSSPLLCWTGMWSQQDSHRFVLLVFMWCSEGLDLAPDMTSRTYCTLKPHLDKKQVGSFSDAQFPGCWYVICNCRPVPASKRRVNWQTRPNETQGCFIVSVFVSQWELLVLLWFCIMVKNWNSTVSKYFYYNISESEFIAAKLQQRSYCMFTSFCSHMFFHVL